MSSQDGAEAAEFGEFAAELAAVLSLSAHVLADVHRLAEQLKSALETQAVMDQAIGIVMGRYGGTEGESLERLRTISETEHRELAAVAAEIVDGAISSVRAARHLD